MTRAGHASISGRLEKVKEAAENFQQSVGSWLGRTREGAQEVVKRAVDRLGKSSENGGEAGHRSEESIELPAKITPGMVGDYVNPRTSSQMDTMSSSTTEPVDEIFLSNRQKEELEALVNAGTTSQSIVVRAKIILHLVDGKSKYWIKGELGTAYTTINRWVRRWIELQGNLALIEEKGSKEALRKAICLMLSDAERSGAPTTFTAEQVVQIIALACTPPSEVGVEASQWSVRLLAKAAAELGIVESISPSQVSVFFSSQISNRIAVHTG